ncbi:hypothetical protein CGI07_23930, partial [Vibrio parahaemolyticus]
FSRNSPCYNALLRCEQRNTKAAALRLKHKTHCKPKLPRVANLLKLFVISVFNKWKYLFCINQLQIHKPRYEKIH